MLELQLKSERQLKLVVGCGYVGLRVARAWQAAGHNVVAVTRSAARAAEFMQQGLQPLVADVTQPESLRSLPPADTVLFAMGFDRAAGHAIHTVYVDGLAAVVRSLPKLPTKFLYISSTGVYGPGDGGWVDENSPCVPQRAGGQACLAAEQLLAASQVADRTIILRLAGIYGPGRIPKREDLLAGRELAVNASGYLNLIHVDDAVTAILAADDRARAPRTFVISDGQPVLRSAYYEELARLWAAPSPRFAPPAANSPAAERGLSDKRMRNARMLAELEITLRYTSYREGLAALAGASMGE